MRRKKRKLRDGKVKELLFHATLWVKLQRDTNNSQLLRAEDLIYKMTEIGRNDEVAELIFRIMKKEKLNSFYDKCMDYLDYLNGLDNWSNNILERFFDNPSNYLKSSSSRIDVDPKEFTRCVSTLFYLALSMKPQKPRPKEYATINKLLALLLPCLPKKTIWEVRNDPKLWVDSELELLSGKFKVEESVEHLRHIIDKKHRQATGKTLSLADINKIEEKKHKSTVDDKYIELLKVKLDQIKLIPCTEKTSTLK